MKPSISQQIKQLEKKEQLFLNKPENPLIKSTFRPMADKIQDIIPDKLVSTLDSVFYKGFLLVFEKGSPYIEKTYSRDKIETDFDINNYAIENHYNKRYIKRMDKPSKQAALLNSSFSALEGGILGILGIGLPDIPLFLSVIIKTIYEVALSYGFSYTTSEEEAYILLLISAATASGDRQKEYDRQLEELGVKIDHAIEIKTEQDLYLKAASKTLSDALLTAKFIQGIPLVGIVGGAVNYAVINKISYYARMKYKKRYLRKKLL